MKGVVFNEFLEMVEQEFGILTLDEVVTAGDPGHGGVYTSVGTYDFDELVAMLGALHESTGIPVPDLLYSFGRYLFEAFLRRFPELIGEETDTFTFLSGLEGIIHAEVRKLYPDAELPTFIEDRVNDDTLEMVYESPRRLGVFAKGLMEACVDHYGENIDVEMEEVPGSDGARVLFRLTRVTDGAG
ncbi:MAG: heme NO-binding domain-containing protein [Flavobacteriaceae bacterium]|nr:heme NO-binding domain-containing protein [Flavobacteriaceae bacterium]